jgi:hypothetical protein
VRRLIVRSAVCLDLDDPALAPTVVVLADQPRTEQRPGDLGSRAGQRPPVEDAQEGVLG